MGLRWLGRRSDDPTATQPSLVAGNVLACVLTLGMALPVEQLPARDLAILAFLGVIQIGLAYVCLVDGIRGVPALEASLLLLLEPVLNPIWAWLVHGEAPGEWALTGGAIIMVRDDGAHRVGCRSSRVWVSLSHAARSALVPKRLDLFPLGRHRVDGRPGVAGRAGHLARAFGNDRRSTSRSRSARSAAPRSAANRARRYPAIAACHARSVSPSDRAAAASQ